MYGASGAAGPPILTAAWTCYCLQLLYFSAEAKKAGLSNTTEQSRQKYE